MQKMVKYLLAAIVLILCERYAGLYISVIRNITMVPMNATTIFYALHGILSAVIYVFAIYCLFTWAFLGQSPNILKKKEIVKPFVLAVLVKLVYANVLFPLFMNCFPITFTSKDNLALIIANGAVFTLTHIVTLFIILWLICKPLNMTLQFQLKPMVAVLLACLVITAFQYFVTYWLYEYITVNNEIPFGKWINDDLFNHLSLLFANIVLTLESMIVFAGFRKMLKISDEPLDGSNLYNGK